MRWPFKHCFLYDPAVVPLWLTSQQKLLGGSHERMQCLWVKPWTFMNDHERVKMMKDTS